MAFDISSLLSVAIFVPFALVFATMEITAWIKKRRIIRYTMTNEYLQKLDETYTKIENDERNFVAMIKLYDENMVKICPEIPELSKLIAANYGLQFPNGHSQSFTGPAPEGIDAPNFAKKDGIIGGVICILNLTSPDVIDTEYSCALSDYKKQKEDLTDDKKIMTSHGNLYAFWRRGPHQKCDRTLSIFELLNDSDEI